MKEISDVNSYTLKKDEDGANFNLVFGSLFLFWTAFDIVTEVYEELWYWNIFFALLGFIFIWFGVKGLRDVRMMEKIVNSNEKSPPPPPPPAANQADPPDPDSPAL